MVPHERNFRFDHWHKISGCGLKHQKGLCVTELVAWIAHPSSLSSYSSHFAHCRKQIWVHTLRREGIRECLSEICATQRSNHTAGQNPKVCQKLSRSHQWGLCHCENLDRQRDRENLHTKIRRDWEIWRGRRIDSIKWGWAPRGCDRITNWKLLTDWELRTCRDPQIHGHGHWCGQAECHNS